MKIRNEVKFGAFALLGLILFVVGTKYLQGNKMFGNRMYLYAEYRDVTPLIQSNPIVMKGLRVGKISDMFMDQERGLVITELQFDEAISIPKHAKATIIKTNMLGAGAMEITYSDSITSQDFYQTGDTIPGNKKKDLFDQVENVVGSGGSDLISQVGLLAEELNETVSQLNSMLQDPRGRNAILNTIQDVQVSASNIKEITYSLDSLSSTFVDLIRNTDSVMAGVANNRDNIEGIIQNTKLTTDTLVEVAKEFRKLASNVEATTKSMERAIAKIDSSQGTLGLLVNDRQLYDNLTSVSSSINQLVEDVNKRPGRYVDDIKLYLIERKPPKEKRSKATAADEGGPRGEEN
ncbi:MAG: MlaD family protein [Bacteroidota bacterium]